MFQDKTLQCKVCGNDFVFTAGEQEFYAAKELPNEPKTCKDCRMKRKNANRETREMFDAVCAECGADCKVPFNPTAGKAVYCSDCFAKRRNNQ